MNLIWEPNTSLSKYKNRLNRSTEHLKIKFLTWGLRQEFSQMVVQNSATERMERKGRGEKGRGGEERNGMGRKRGGGGKRCGISPDYHLKGILRRDLREYKKLVNKQITAEGHNPQTERTHHTQSQIL